MYSVDIFVQHYITIIRTPIVTQYMFLLTRLFDEGPFIFLAVATTVLVHLFRGRRYAFLLATTIAVGALAVFILKPLFDVSRPASAVVDVLGKSFPSGHATVSTVFFVMLMYIFDDHLKRWWRIVFNLFCIGGIFSVAFSRVYLGVHWVSDVAGGILLGGLLCLLSVFVFNTVISPKR